MTTSGVDLGVSYLFLNQLNALFQGHYHQLQRMKLLGSSRFSNEQLQYSSAVLGVIEKLVMRIRHGIGIFSEDDFDPQVKPALTAAVNFITSDLRETVKMIGTFPQKEALQKDVRAYCEYIIVVTRVYITQAFYVKGMMFHAEITKNEELLEILNNLKKPLIDESHRVEAVIPKIKAFKWDGGIFTGHNEQITDIPTVIHLLKTNLQEAMIMSKTLGQTLRSAEMGISEQELREWDSIGIAREELLTINLWKIYGFTPVTTKKWWEVGVLHPVSAYQLRTSGVTPEQLESELLRLQKESQNEANTTKSRLTNFELNSQAMGGGSENLAINEIFGSQRSPGAEDIDEL